MPSADTAAKPAAEMPKVTADRGQTFQTIANLWPYMWPADRPDLKQRVLVAFLALIAAKVITVLVPYTYKWVTDALTGAVTDGARGPQRGPTFLCGIENLVCATDVEVGILLACEGGIWQVFGGGG